MGCSSKRTNFPKAGVSVPGNAPFGFLRPFPVLVDQLGISGRYGNVLDVFIELFIVRSVKVSRYPAFLNARQLHRIGKYLVPCLLGVKAERVMLP